MEEYEKFKTDIISVGGSSIGIVIPAKLAKFAGFEKGDFVEIIIKKIQKQDE